MALTVRRRKVLTSLSKPAKMAFSVGTGGPEPLRSAQLDGLAHHLTLTLLALGFLQVERLRLREKKSTGDGGAGPADLHGVVAAATAECGRDRGAGERSAAA